MCNSVGSPNDPFPPYTSYGVSVRNHFTVVDEYHVSCSIREACACVNYSGQTNIFIESSFSSVPRRLDLIYLGSFCITSVRDGFVHKTDSLHCCHYHAACGRGLIFCLSVS